MTITLAGGFGGGVSASAGAATTGTRTTTTGNFIVSAFSCQNAAASAWATTVATTQNLTVFGRRATGTGDSIDMAYLPNITGHAGDAVSANSASTFKSCSAAEFAGVKTSSPLDASAITGGSSGAYTGGTTFSCPTVTTTVAGDLVIGVATIECGSLGTFSGVGGWQVASSYGDGSVSSTSVLVWQVVGAPGNYTPQFTFSINGTGSIGQTFAFFDATPPATAVTTAQSRDRDRRAQRDWPAFPASRGRTATRDRGRQQRSQFELYHAASTVSSEAHTSSATAVLGLSAAALQAHAGSTAASEPIALTARAAQAGAHNGNATAALALSERVTQVKSVADFTTGVLALAARALQLRSVADSVKTALGLAATANDVKSGGGKATTALGLTAVASESTARAQKATTAIGLTTRAVQLKSVGSSSQEALALTARATQVSQRVQSGKAALGLTARATQLKSVADSVRAALGLTATVNKVGGAIQVTVRGALGLTATALQATGRSQAARAVLALTERATPAKGAVDVAQGALGLTARTIDAKSSAQSTSSALGLSGRSTTARKAITTSRGAVGFTVTARGVRSATVTGAKAVIALVASAFGIQVTFVADPDPLLVTWYESGPISWSEAEPLQGTDRYVLNYEEELL